MTRTVGHFVDTYLELTQTFIYQYLTNYDKYDPFVCAKRSENVELFPFEPKYVFLDSSPLDPRVWLHRALSEWNVKRFEHSYYGDILEENDPSIIHAHFGPMGVDIATRQDPDCPLVTSFYGYDISELVKGDDSLRRDYRELFARGDLFFIEGPAMQQKLQNLGCPEEKICLQPIAIETSRIDPGYPSPDGAPTVLMVGRFVEKKGMPDGIRAFAEAYGDIDGAELHIVGGEHGEYTEADLAELAEEQGVDDKVSFLGYLPYDEYLDEVHSCDLLLAPSKRASSGDSEGGAPTVLLEAQASGKPIVSTTHADIPYVVENGVSGRLVTPGDVEGLADELLWFRDNPDAYRQMGQEGRENMENNHDITALSDKLEREYDRLVEG